MISSNLHNIRIDIRDICLKSGRDANDIVLVGVTKYSAVEDVKTGIEAGLQHVAENYVKDAQRKFAQLGSVLQGVTRHLIGHLQTNKAKLAVELFDMIQSVDSLKLAQEIDKQAGKIGKQMDILLEVNSGEEQKTGWPAAEVPAVLEQIVRLENVRVKGLMGMAPFVDDEQTIRSCFRSLRTLCDDLSKEYAGHPRVTMKVLSMGMSADYKIALEEGATMLRIGSKIFKET